MIHATTLQVRNNYLIRINVDNFGLIIDWSFAITYKTIVIHIISIRDCFVKCKTGQPIWICPEFFSFPFPVLNNNI